MDRQNPILRKPAFRPLLQIRKKWLIAMGDRFRGRRDWLKSAHHYQQALRLDPDMRPIWVQLGHALKESGSLDEALHAYRQASRLPGADGDAPFHLGLLAKRMGHFSTFTAALVQAIRENPDNPRAHQELRQIDAALYDEEFYHAHLRGELGHEIPARRAHELLHHSKEAEIEEVRRSELFDAAWYADRYPDVVADGLEPLRHFMDYGWRELRDPNSLFDTKWYLQTHPDVADSGGNPLLHYIRHGAHERRDTSPNFRPSVFQDPNTARGPFHLAAACKYLQAIGKPVAGHGARVFASPPRVLIIAELSIPQCRKYRVDQKRELLRRLGYDSTALDWHDEGRCKSALATHSLVIFYRVPAVDSILRCIEQAKARGLKTFWEVDDLIFDPNAYLENTSLKVLTPELQLSVLSGVPLYRSAMLACDEAIASTNTLAKAMVEAGVTKAHLVENALDTDTLEAAADAMGKSRKPDRAVRIVYGSGTKTHDNDFLEASAAIRNCFAEFPQVKLRIIGELGLPDTFADFADRIERFPGTSYKDYLGLVAECDIAIAPLEPTLFNDAKSNIKFIEASMTGLPTVCSPRAEFASIVTHGKNGMLADDDASWFLALKTLVSKKYLRRSMAAAAKASILERYDPEVIARSQLAPIIRQYEQPRKPLRVLSANVFFWPRSFGGATIVAEQMAKLLNARDDTEVVVFTTSPGGTTEPYRLIQYSAGSIPVFALNLPEVSDPQLDFDTPYTADAFREVLQLTAPDVVHIHSIQTLGARLLQVCKEEGVAVVVTLHDAWWICGRQFMIKGDGAYCFQKRIDLNVCGACVSNPGLNIYRQFRLRDMLAHADLLLAPSEFFHGIYAANGFAPDRLKVNRNGVARPDNFRRSKSSNLRFGYVGGNAALKGANLIRKVFAEIERSDYELVLVDNLSSLGFSSLKAEDWPIGGRLRILPGYDQDTMDSFYSQIDVLLFPTQWKESFGLTVREALIRDIWVIATDAGGVVEDIVDGENGNVIPLLDNGTALKTAIERALDSTETIIQHTNPYKSKIVDLDQQATELRKFLEMVSRNSLMTCPQNSKQLSNLNLVLSATD